MTTSTNPRRVCPRRSRRLLSAILLALLIALAIFLCLWIGTRPQATDWTANANTIQMVRFRADSADRTEQAPPFVPGFYCNSCSSPECIERCKTFRPTVGAPVGAHVRFHWCELMPAEVSTTSSQSSLWCGEMPTRTTLSLMRVPVR